MENGARNGSHTNHDRDRRPNGVNGANFVSEKALEKGKGRAEPQQNVTPISPTIPNGVNGGFLQTSRQNGAEDLTPKDVKAQFGQLPPEIEHITTGYMSLSTLLSRLAQKTHNDLGRTILELAQMPVPASSANGSSSPITTADDNSADNLNKKLKLLKFSQDAHTEWTKALVITNWSRRSEDVSKMIDLKIHLNKQKGYYDQALDKLMMVKRNLVHARLPNPDLKTALEVLTTGKSSWMPELGYIQPPPLTAKEILKSLENLNTLLSIRLNLHEYDNIPWHFKDYIVKSGRVTFTVGGEFEVDLTIADEDPETQFWFIDFRFLFSPSLLDMPFHIRAHIESRVNETLLQDGLSGCYNYLHGMVLSHKISEFRRQAVQLARGKWVEGLKVEALNRALSIQYWLDRYGRNGPKSWIILGVHSGKRKTGRPHPKDTSRLFIRWFRDSKEVKDVEISFDAVEISAESLLKAVIAKHVEHILTAIYNTLKVKALFADHESLLSLTISSDNPAESELKVQLTSKRYLSVRIEPITGRFIFGPASRLNADFEFRLNSRSIDPAADGHNYIEGLRHLAVTEDIVSRAVSLGWTRVDNPGLKQEDLRAVVPKDTSQVVWLRRPGWRKNWYIAISLSMSGERWWLFETTDPPHDASNAPPSKNAKKESNVKIASHLLIPIKAMSPIATYQFLNTLHLFAAALLSDYTNLKSLHERRAQYLLQSNNKVLTAVELPSIYVRLSSLIPENSKTKSKKDVVKLTFQGLEAVQKPKDIKVTASQPSNQQALVPLNAVSDGVGRNLESSDEDIFAVTEARISLKPSALVHMKDRIDQDIAFDCDKGSLALRLRSKVGESVIPSLVERTVRVQRLVDFVGVFQIHESSLICETITLGRITFTYGKPLPNADRDAMDMDRPGSQGYKAVVDFSAGNDIMKLILEKGNPHLQIADHLTTILNSKEGLNGVATILPLTLPVLRGLDSIEVIWGSIPKSTGEVFVFVRATDWYIIRYHLVSAASPTGILKIIFEVKLRQRRAVPWWYLKRIDIRDNAGDDLDLALRPVWNSAGEGWQGMRVSGVAQPKGVETLLGKMDEAMRDFAVGNNANGAQPMPRPTQLWRHRG
ncbi:hypothetical protein G7Y89_g3739 [Cudoniella acicularis]|uniref:Mediator of RNA polymerase II transcription subunit 14 n=1 Tax=Cudoniella acicularis TaxID=354080 RepID=A0A8H4RSN1_9HELO|nr:hypothetical protein G7Y89_g3739 [Cudoniella acicularis]